MTSSQMRSRPHWSIPLVKESIYFVVEAEGSCHSRSIVCATNPHLSAASLILHLRDKRGFLEKGTEDKPFLGRFPSAMTAFLVDADEQRVRVLWQSVLKRSSMFE